jgi:hypothetical protein
MKPITVRTLSAMKKALAEGAHVQIVDHHTSSDCPIGSVREPFQITDAGYSFIAELDRPMGKHAAHERFEAWSYYPKAKAMKFNPDGTIVYLPRQAKTYTVRLVKP